MSARRAGLWLALVLVLRVAAAQAAGFTELTIPDPGQPDLAVGIWYPSDAPPTEQRLGLGQQSVARDAPLAGHGLRLAVISHGTGSWYAGHADTALALADAGFVVAAVTHTGDNFRDRSRATQVQDRPRQIGRVLDYMLGEWPGRAQLDPARVGMFGYSAGGFTALVAIGGIPHLERVAAHCGANPDEWLCHMLQQRGVDLDQMPQIPASAWHRDARIRAAVIAAPALGFSFGPSGLADVNVPVQLWRADLDQVLPQPWYAQMVREDLPHPPEYHVVANAGHFAFLAPCSDALAHAAAEVCADPPGFDRVAFHKDFNAQVVRFLSDHL